MDILNQIIAGLNKEEIRFYKLLATRIETTAEARKDIKLFDEMRKKGEGFDESLFLKKHYPDVSGPTKNAYYRLKNRLLRDVSESLALHHFKDDEQVYVLNLLALEKYFITKNNFKVASYFLKKAETLAQKIENYQLLDIIYADFIKLSHELFSVNPETYIHKRTENLQKINSLKQIDDILAAVAYRLKVTQNFSQSDNTVLELLEKTIADFSQDTELKKSPVLRFKIYQAASQLLLQRREYKALEAYLIKLYKEFVKEKLFSKSNHDTKLQMLTYIVNTLFKNNKTKQSLQYAELLKNAMDEFNRLHYDKYFFFYYNSLVINYSVIDKEKAIEILNELKTNKQLKSNEYYEIFVYLNLAIQNFDLGNYHEAIRALNKLYLLDSYKNTDASLKFKIALADLIIRYELQDYDVFDYKMAQFKKDFKPFLQQKETLKEAKFVEIIDEMIKSDHLITNKKTTLKITEFIDKYRRKEVADDEILNYVQWLSSKQKSKS